MYSLETVLANYRLLSHSDLHIRDQANQFLIRAIEDTHVWSIAQEIITVCSSTDERLLGAQLLYQKIESSNDHLSLQQRQSLRGFLFVQLTDDALTLPLVRKLGAGAALIAASLMPDHWPLFVRDLAKFMETSPLQFRNGLIFLEILPEQLRKTNRVKHGIKIQIRQNLLGHSEFMGSIFISGLSVTDNTIIELSLEAIESWVNMGLPLLKLSKILQKLIQISNFASDSRFDSFLDQCFKIICDGLHYCSQEKSQTLDQVDFSLQRQKYSSEELNSLATVINYIRGTKALFLNLLDEERQINKVEIYLTIIKETVLSYGFMLIQELGYEFIQLIIKTLSSNNLQLSYSTFEFWLQLGQKMIKCKDNSKFNSFFWQIVDNLLDIILHKTILQNQSLFLEISCAQDTIDDINFITFNQYRKQAQNIIKFCYSYFTQKKKQEGSTNFFKKLSDYIQVDSQKKRGIELSIYAIQSIIEEIVHDYDQENVINFIVYLMNQMSQQNGFPPRLILEVINLIKQSSAFMVKNQQLLLKCAQFCLGFIQDELYSESAFESFESIMKNVNVCENQNVIDDLLNFYESKCVQLPLILNKILQITLTSIVKLNDTNTITNYLKRLIVRFQQKSINKQDSLNNHVLLDQIRTLLDSYQCFPFSQKQCYLPIFMKISMSAIQIIYQIILDCLNKRLQWSSTELGMSVMTIKSTLRLCDNVSAQYIPITGYIQLMNLVLMIFKSDEFLFFLEYVGLLDIFHQILSKLTNSHSIIGQWLRRYMPNINLFFLNYTGKYKTYVNGIDPDVVNHFLAIQQSVILYDQSIYLEQSQHQEIFTLALTSLQHFNEKNLQRRVIRFLNLCINLQQVYNHKYTAILQIIFISLPNFNSGYYADLGKIIIVLFGDIDFQTKQNICCQMLQNEPYVQEDNQIRHLAGKFIAFALETKMQKHIKRAMGELSKIASRKTSVDQAMHLQLKFASCKKDLLHQQQLRPALE